MRYDFDEVIDRRNTASVKWDDVATHFGGADVLPMWVADMDFLPPRPVVEAISRRAASGFFGYTLRPDSLYQAISDWLQRRHGWQVERSWLSFTPGIVPAIALAVKAFSHPGDKVIVQSPVYHPFFAMIERNGRQMVNNQLILQNGRYTMDFDGLEKCFGPRVKLLVLCSPHNPVGRVWTQAELARLAEICLRHDATVVSDEIHFDLVPAGAKHIPLASLSPEIAQRTVTCIAPSKTFNIAGLATSAVIVSDRKLRDEFEATVASAGLGGSNVFGVVAWEAAYREGEEWLDQVLEYLRGNREFLASYVAARIPRIKVVQPEGTYLAWLDCRELGLDSSALKQFFGATAKVGLNDGAAFGPGGEGFQRMNIACPRSVLEDGLGRIERAVSTLG